MPLNPNMRRPELRLAPESGEIGPWIMSGFVQPDGADHTVCLDCGAHIELGWEFRHWESSHRFKGL